MTAPAIPSPFLIIKQEDYLDSLPLGHKFKPTDADLLYYLDRLSRDLPAPQHRIHHIPNFYAVPPADLAGYRRYRCNPCWFFVSQRGPLPLLNEGGQWHALPYELKVRQNDSVGVRRGLEFVADNGITTDYVCLEYWLGGGAIDPTDWVLIVLSTDRGMVESHGTGFQQLSLL